MINPRSNRLAPAPPIDFNGGNFVGLGVFRLRPVIFGLCVLEEKHKWRDGRVEWLRAARHRSVSVTIKSAEQPNAR